MPALPCDNLGPDLPTPLEMAAWDAASLNEFQIPEAMLMENASREAFHVLSGLLRPQSRILVIMGGGNNGGDGACLARHLLDAGHSVLVCHTKPLDKLSSAAREHAYIAQKTGVPFTPLAFADGTFASPLEYRDITRKPHLVVDALLGTGFTGHLRDRERDIIRLINLFGETAPVAAMDIPSGLDGMSGLPRPEAVRATLTITFEAGKTGLAYHHAKKYTGDTHIRRIGIPAAARRLHPASYRLLSPEECAWPPASKEMHKGTAGRVLIFGGSKGLTGAPVLAALGALRTGAGLVTVACPGVLEAMLRPGFPEIMTHGLGNGNAWSNALLPECIKAARELPHASALVLGPGIGRSEETKGIVAALIKEKNRPPLVLDADGLFPLAPEGDDGTLNPLLADLRETDCITPHPGEAAGILGTSAHDVQAARTEALRALTDQTRATVVLKGVNTLIGRCGAPVFIAPFATPSLSVGGSGDVLSGIIAAYLARIRAEFPFNGKDAFRAVCLGVYTHGKAGEYLDAAYPVRGAMAREIADAVPHALRPWSSRNSY